MSVVNNNFGQVKNQYYMEYYVAVKNGYIDLICNRRIL